MLTKRFECLNKWTLAEVITFLSVSVCMYVCVCVCMCVFISKTEDFNLKIDLKMIFFK